jgi:hypothetical protein
MSEKEIEAVLGMKLEEVKNTKKKSKYEEMEIYVTKKLNNWHINNQWEIGNNHSTRTIKIIIIMYMKENKIMLRRSTIDTYYYYFIANSSVEQYQEDAVEIYEQIYNNNERNGSSRPKESAYYGL